MTDRQIATRRVSRPRFTGGGAAVAIGLGNAGAPSIALVPREPVSVGGLHPVSGALADSGQQGWLGPQLAIGRTNASGGIVSLGGATHSAVLGDGRSSPDGGVQEVERMAEVGASAIVDACASTICRVSSPFDRHTMVYGPTCVVDRQDQGAAPVDRRILDDDIEVIFPKSFAAAERVLPVPA